MTSSADDREPDSQLVARFRVGERPAFDGIVSRYRRDVYRLGYRMTGSHEDADDIAQETFLRAYGALPGFRGDASLRTWLFRIAMNLAINLGRSRAAHRTDDSGLDPAPAAALGALPASDAALLDDERKQQLRLAVEGLPPRQRQVVVLKVYEDLQFQEIAEVLECPIGTAKANFFHAVNNLRKALGVGAERVRARP